MLKINENKLRADVLSESANNLNFKSGGLKIKRKQAKSKRVQRMLKRPLELLIYLVIFLFIYYQTLTGTRGLGTEYN